MKEIYSIKVKEIGEIYSFDYIGYVNYDQKLVDNPITIEGDFYVKGKTYYPKHAVLAITYK